MLYNSYVTLKKTTLMINNHHSEIISVGDLITDKRKNMIEKNR